MSQKDYGGSGGRSTMMVDGWKMAALQEIPGRHKTTESDREHVCVATHLFLTKRMATSTSSMKTRTPALIPAIFTTRSVCLAGSGMTSGSSVAPVNIVKKHMDTALVNYWSKALIPLDLFYRKCKLKKEDLIVFRFLSSAHAVSLRA